MSSLKEKLEERDQLIATLTEVDLQITQLIADRREALKQDILSLCDNHETSIDELFGVSPEPSNKYGIARGERKYIVNGETYDGRAARTMDEFTPVRNGNAIDDRAAVAQGMINPAWLKSGKPAATQFIRDYDLEG